MSGSLASLFCIVLYVGKVVVDWRLCSFSMTTFIFASSPSFYLWHSFILISRPPQLNFQKILKCFRHETLIENFHNHLPSTTKQRYIHMLPLHEHFLQLPFNARALIFNVQGLKNSRWNEIFYVSLVIITYHHRLFSI